MKQLQQSPEMQVNGGSDWPNQATAMEMKERECMREST